MIHLKKILSKSFTLVANGDIIFSEGQVFNDVDALNIMNNELGINLNMKRGIIIDLVSIIIFYYFGRLFFINKDVKN